MGLFLESPVEMESWYRPKAEELIKMRTTVERIYDEIASNIQDSFLQNMDIEAYAEISTKLDKKHIRQISSIIGYFKSFFFFVRKILSICVVETWTVRKQCTNFPLKGTDGSYRN